MVWSYRNWASTLLLICQSLCFNEVLTVVLEYIYFVWTLFYCRSSRSTVWLWCWEFRWVDTSCWDPGHWLHAVWARLDDRWTEWQARNLSLQFCEDYSWEYHFGYVHKGYVLNKFTMLSRPYCMCSFTSTPRRKFLLCYNVVWYMVVVKSLLTQ